MLKDVLLVGAGGFVGAVARYGVTALVQRWVPGSLPVGTLAVNVLGCLAAGAALAALEQRAALGSALHLALVTGLLGSLTTFSTFGVETLALMREGRAWPAAGNVLLNVVLSLGAVALGHALVAGRAS